MFVTRERADPTAEMRLQCVFTSGSGHKPRMVGFLNLLYGVGHENGGFWRCLDC